VKAQIRGRNVEVTQALRDYVHKRLRKLDKYFDEPPTVQVMLTVQRGRHRAEMTLTINAMLLRGEEETDDMFASIDLVVDKLERQMAKYKTRLQRRGKEGLGRTAANAVAAEPDEEPRIVRTKRFAIKPMTPEEAVMQMNLLGHDFFVFTNALTEEVNVVYRRKDGNYGLIEPIPGD